MRSGLRKTLVGASLVALLFPASACARQDVAAAQAEASVPKYRFDPTWPKPLPNKWMMQSVGGIFVDQNDNIWVLDRPRDAGRKELYAEQTPPEADCCVHPPSVFEFSPEGEVLQAWGGPDYVPGWPQNEHTIFVDREGFVWIGGSVAGDSLLKFTQDGKFVSDFGHRGPHFDGPAAEQPANNQQTDLLLRGVSGATIDEEAHELYLADGYLHKRVLVYDSVTGAFKRGWGAYGRALADITNEWIPRSMTPGARPISEFRGGVHCVAISNDGLVYVCDRAGNRVQVFTKDGTFQKEIILAPQTIDRGSAQSVAFSPDPDQSYLFISDTQNAKIWIVDRETGKVAGSFGDRSYNGGGFIDVHFAAVDSRGDVYTAEIEPTKRVQKFVPVTPWAK